MPAEAPAKQNVFKRKIGPLPTWVWVLIVAGVILAWALVRRSSSSSQDSSPQGVPAGDVPQFVNQTFVQPGPPGPPDEDDNDDDDKHFPHEPPPVPPMHPKPPGSRNPPPTRNPRGPHGGKGGPPPHEPPPRHRKRRHAGAGRGT